MIMALAFCGSSFKDIEADAFSQTGFIEQPVSFCFFNSRRNALFGYMFKLKHGLLFNDLQSIDYFIRLEGVFFDRKFRNNFFKGS